MIYSIVCYFSLLSPLLPLTVGFKQRKTLIWLYALLGFTFDLFSLLARAYTQHFNISLNLSLAENLFMIIEFTLISFYYKNKIFKNNSFYPALITLILLFTISTANHYNVMFSFIGGTIFDFACIVYAVFGFYTLLIKKQVVFLDKSPFFWVNVALLIYCTGNFLVFLFGEYFMKSNKEFMSDLWIFHNILNIIFSSLIAVSFFKRNTEA